MQAGVLSAEKLAEALALQKSMSDAGDKRRLGALLIERGAHFFRSHLVLHPRTARLNGDLGAPPFHYLAQGHRAAAAR